MQLRKGVLLIRIALQFVKHDVAEVCRILCFLLEARVRIIRFGAESELRLQPMSLLRVL